MGKPVKPSSNASNKAIYHNYKKLLRKEGLNTTSVNHSSIGKHVDDKKKRTNRLLETHEKVKVRQGHTEATKCPEERQKDRLEKQKVRKQRQKRINKRTKKGQPVMKNKMELMLEKIMKDKETYHG